MTEKRPKFHPSRWSELSPEPALLDALAHAGPRPSDDGTQNAKRAWSERFANGCAIAVASALRATPLSKRNSIRPESLASGTEPVTPLGSGTSKRIDVTVVSPILGLELGVSLKGFNFRDQRSNNFDKNLTGRLYELGDEVRHVHEHLPHAFMVGLLFLPLESTVDKSDRVFSSFAHAVLKLRARSSRLDASLMMHAARCDAGYVALYSLGGDDIPFGTVRFFDVRDAPPRRGRPTLRNTRSLSEFALILASRAMQTAEVSWGEAEDESRLPKSIEEGSGAYLAADMEELLRVEAAPEPPEDTLNED